MFSFCWGTQLTELTEKEQEALSHHDVLIRKLRPDCIVPIFNYASPLIRALISASSKLEFVHLYTVRSNIGRLDVQDVPQNSYRRGKLFVSVLSIPIEGQSREDAHPYLLCVYFREIYFSLININTIIFTLWRKIKKIIKNNDQRKRWKKWLHGI